MRLHAASRSASLTPSTWSKRATALRTWLASLIRSLACFGNANVCEVAISRKRDACEAYPRYSRDAILPASLTASGFGLAAPNRPPHRPPPKTLPFTKPKSKIQTAGGTCSWALKKPRSPTASDSTAPYVAACVLPSPYWPDSLATVTSHVSPNASRYEHEGPLR